MRKMTENLAIYALMAVCFGVFCYMGWRYVEVEFLAFTNGDAMPQFLQLQKLYQGLIALDVKQFFAFEFYNYGFFYYLLNLLAALPFIITENYSLQIYAPRVLNALFSIANIWLLYRIARIYLSALNALLLVGGFIAMAGFWHLGYVFKPDVFQAFFVLACVYFLLRDGFSFGKHYTLAWISLGLGIGLAKFQAILFVPMIYAYICLPALSMEARQIRLALKRCALSTLGVFAIWIATNPYLLHKRGFKAWLSMFEGNMRSNATNHGAYTQVPLSDKLTQVVETYYFEAVVFVALLLLCCYLLWLGLYGVLRVFRNSALGEQCATIHKEKVDSSDNTQTLQNSTSTNAARRQDLGDKNGALQGESRAHTRVYVAAESPQQNKGYRSPLGDVSLESPFLAPKQAKRCGRELAGFFRKPTTKPSQDSLLPFAPIAAGFAISLAYLLFFVNKAWEAYYFSTMLLGCVLFIPLALIAAKTSNGGGAALCRDKEVLSNRCSIALAWFADSRRAYV